MAEPADPKGEQTICICGHPEHPDHDTEEPAWICRTCQREDRHPAGCWGLFPQGSVAVEVDEHGQPVGDDLHQAIQAAAKALDDAYSDADCGWFGPYLPSVAKIAVEAAWPRIRAIQAEVAVLRHSTDQMRDLTREQDQTLQAIRDRHADLEVYTAELRDLLEQTTGLLYHQRFIIPKNLDNPDQEFNELRARWDAALQVDGPARGHAILAEVQRLRTLLDDQDRCPNCGVTRKGATHRTVSIGVCEITLDQAAQLEGDHA